MFFIPSAGKEEGGSGKGWQVNGGKGKGKKENFLTPQIAACIRNTSEYILLHKLIFVGAVGKKMGREVKGEGRERRKGDKKRSGKRFAKFFFFFLSIRYAKLSFTFVTF